MITITRVILCQEIIKSGDKLIARNPLHRISMPANGNIKGFIVYEASSPDEIGKKKQIRAEILAVNQNKKLVIDQSEVEIVSPKGTVMYELDSLPLIGPGEYVLQILDVTDTASEKVLYRALLLTVLPAPELVAA